MGLAELTKNQQGLLMRQLFPFHQEMLFILILATCSKFADVRASLLIKQEERRKRKEQASSIPDISQIAYDEALHEEGFSSSATDQESEDDKSTGSLENN